MSRFLRVVAFAGLLVFLSCGPAEPPCHAACPDSCDPFVGTCVGVDGGTGGGSGGGGGAGGGSGNYCSVCTTAGQCGGSMNFCLGTGTSGFCGVDCGSGQACPAGASCVQISDATNAVVGSNCVPTAGTCNGGGVGGGSGGAGGGGGSSCTDTWGNYAGGFFSSYCSNCHGGEFATYSGVAGKASSIRSRVSSGNMPQGGGLGATERAQILSWLDCGAQP